MKKLIKGALFLAIVGTTIVGCEKESTSYIDSNSNKKKIKSNNTFDKSNESLDTTYIPYSDFESEFEVFVDNFFSNHPNGLISGELLEETNLYQIITQETAPIDPSTSLKIICRFGSDYDAMMSCLDRASFCIGYADCARGYTTRNYGDGSGRVWYEGWVDC